jgi:hypothetical protein
VKHFGMIGGLRKRTFARRGRCTKLGFRASEGMR